MLILVSYDVSTLTQAGRRRLRRVAKVCQNHGQRVQKSVFECRVDRAGFEELERRLVAEIDTDTDNLRLYRLGEPSERNVREHGNFRSINFDGPLVV